MGSSRPVTARSPRECGHVPAASAGHGYAAPSGSPPSVRFCASALIGAHTSLLSDVSNLVLEALKSPQVFAEPPKATVTIPILGMPRRQTRFLQSDVRRAVQGAMDAGLVVARVEIDPDGKIVIILSDGTKPETTTPLEAWKAKQNARPA